MIADAEPGLDHIRPYRAGPFHGKGTYLAVPDGWGNGEAVAAVSSGSAVALMAADDPLRLATRIQPRLTGLEHQAPPGHRGIRHCPGLVVMTR